MLSFKNKHKAKRERELNWSTNEKKILVELVKSHADIIESKIIPLGDKFEAWKKIQTKFNTLTSTNRDVLRIREQWRRMKSFAKMEIMRHRNEVSII